MELREDFVAFYAAAALVSGGVADAIYQPEVVGAVEHAILGRPAGRDTGLAFMNPPFVAGLLQPLTWLSYGKAQAVWFAVSALTVVASLALLWPELRKLGRRWALIFSVAALTSYPVFSSLLYGQLSPLILLSWVIFYRLSARGRDAGAGLALAASLMKPQLAVVPVLYLFTTRRWRALAGFATGAAALVGISVALAGPKATLIDYPTLLLQSIGWQEEFGVNRVHMFGWNSFFTWLLPPTESTPTLLLTVVLATLTLVAAALVWRRQRFLDDGSRPTLALATATILASPHIHTHDLQILVLPAALLVAYRRDAVSAVVAALLFFLVPLTAMGPNIAAPVLAVFLLVVVMRATHARVKTPSILVHAGAALCAKLLRGGAVRVTEVSQT